MDPLRKYKLSAVLLTFVTFVTLGVCFYVSSISSHLALGSLATLVMGAASILVTRPTRTWKERLSSRIAGWIVFAAAFLFVLRLAYLEFSDSAGRSLADQIVETSLLLCVIFSMLVLLGFGLLFHAWRRCRKKGPGALGRIMQEGSKIKDVD